jgi:glycosyltransferase involved in cell wall biosynthesis
VAVDPDGIADGVRTLLATPAEERAGMGDHGRALIEREYAVAPRVAALEAVLRGARSGR